MQSLAQSLADTGAPLWCLRGDAFVGLQPTWALEPVDLSGECWHDADQGLSDFTVREAPWEGSRRHRLLCRSLLPAPPPPRVSDFVGLGWGPSCILASSPAVLMLMFWGACVQNQPTTDSRDSEKEGTTEGVRELRETSQHQGLMGAWRAGRIQACGGDGEGVRVGGNGRDSASLGERELVRVIRRGTGRQ